MCERPTETGSGVGVLLEQARSGNAEASEQLMSLLYTEMRGLAGAIMRDQKPGHTLQPTALVHEVWMKIAGNLDAIKDRAHFFAVSAMAMRQILADHAKAHRREKRGGGAKRITLYDVAGAQASEIDIVAFHDCLERLSELNERHAKIVELRLLGTLTIEETAQHLGISESTVKADWRMARAWLLRELLGEDAPQ